MPLHRTPYFQLLARFFKDSSRIHLSAPVTVRRRYYEPGRTYDTSKAFKQMTEENKSTQQYLELYKLAVEMADRVSARRASANAFFLTVNTALLAFVSSGLDDMLWLVALAGIALSGTWWVLLKSYRELNAAKFDVITEMEKILEAQVFAQEWKRIKEKRQEGWRGRYAEFGAVERFVPLIFAALYTAVFVGTVL
jgi:hypothetical protein